MKWIVVFTLIVLNIGCKNRNFDECSIPVEQDLSKPGVLIIGDSISLGYTPVVKSRLPELDVTHAQCNSMSSTNGVARVKDWISARDRWHVITFNHGFWDIPPGEQGVSVEQYAANLRIEGALIKAKADNVVFFTSTHVPDGWEPFDNATVAQYNAAAVAVMNELGIQVEDLGSVSHTIPHLHPADNDLHWTEAGSAVLGEFVAQVIGGF